MEVLMPDEKDVKLKLATQITVENNVSGGDVIDTNALTVIRGEPFEIPSGITLDDIHTFYVNNDNSGEAAYQYFTDFLKENKNNPEVINNTVTAILAELSNKYDKTNVEHGKVGNTQAEYISTVFSSGKDEETGALICGTIHNFLRDSLQDAGIPAVTVVGGQITNKNDFTNHACLLYQNNDGTYTFNNYGKSATVAANNVKEAIYTVHKDTGLLESGGQITIHDKNGSYQEYALSESAAYGHLVDKKNYNAATPFDNSVAQNSELGVIGNVSSVGNISGSVDATFASQTENGAKSTTVGAEFKRTGENAEFYNSYSIGVNAEHAQTKTLNKNNILTYDVSGVYSHTTGQLGGQTYTNQFGNNYDKQGGEKISYETFMARGSVGVETNLFNNGNTSVSNGGSASLIGNFVLGHSNHYSSSYDARLTIEDGIQVQTGDKNQTFTGQLSGGAVIDTQQDNNGMRPTVGGKLNIGTDYKANIGDNFALDAKASGYGLFTKASTDYGVQANVGAVFTNSNRNSKIKNIWGAAGVDFETQHLHLGGFNQQTEKNIAFNTAVGVDINKNTKVSLNYSQSKNRLDPLKNKQMLSATMQVNF